MAHGVDYTLLDDPHGLIHHIRNRLATRGAGPDNGADGLNKGERPSAVLMAVTLCPVKGGEHPHEPCLILNKRSRKVRQPGDLCFPGGGIHILDSTLSKLLHLPGFPLGWQASPDRGVSFAKPVSRMIKRLLATSLREAWEEMRLNPFGVRFLGALPTQRLVMFERLIQPLVAWARPHQRFRPNWEVERIVFIPLRKLLDRENYGRYLLTFNGSDASGRQDPRVFPCFLHQGEVAREMLWGATYRITMDFLHIVFDFRPPEMETLPIFEGTLDETYLNPTVA